MSIEMLFWGLVWETFCVDYAIVHENGEPPQHNLLSKDGVHHHLEGSW